MSTLISQHPLWARKTGRERGPLKGQRQKVKKNNNNNNKLQLPHEMYVRDGQKIRSNDSTTKISRREGAGVCARG